MLYSRTLLFIHPICTSLGFSDGSDVKESACNAGGLGWEDPLEKDMATHFSILAWRIPMDKSTVHGVTKSQTQREDKHITVYLFVCIC